MRARESGSNVDEIDPLEENWNIFPRKKTKSTKCQHERHQEEAEMPKNRFTVSEIWTLLTWQTSY